MPIQVPLLNGGNIPLRQTGISVPRTAQLQAGNPDLGRAVSQIGDQLGKLAEREQRANDARQMLEFETAMRSAEERQQMFQQETQEQDTWLPNWQTQEQELQKSLEKMKLSPDARLTLQSTLGRYVDNKRMSIREQAFGQSQTRANKGFANRLDQAIIDADPESVSSTMRLWRASGVAIPEDLDGIELRANERLTSRIKEKGNESAENQWKAAVLMADEKGLEASLQLGKERAGWDDDYIKVKRLAGMEGIERTKAVKQSKSEAEFLGEIFIRKAKGEVIVASQIENWVAENKIDKDTGARLLVATKSEQGAMQGEFYDFLNNEVDQYDPMKDPDGVKSYEMTKKAAMLGLNASQMDFFNARLNRAAKLNGPQRAQQSVLSAGKKVIGEMLKDVGTTRAWDSDAEILFKDKVKLEAFGIPKDISTEIEKLTKGEFTWGGQPTGKGIDKAKALQLFKQHSATRVAAKPAGLTDAEWGKMVTLSTSDVSVNPDTSMSAEFNRAILEEGLESWYQHELNKRGTPPDEKEVRAWVGDKTRAVLQGVGAANLFKTPETSAVNTGMESQRYTKLADGSYEGVASSYGYAGDADNGYNSLGMLRGEQPWYGELPTVALAPRMAEELGVQLPRKNKDGTWDWSKSIVEVEAGGKKTKAIFDETGMYLVEASKNKLIDLTPEASDILGLPQKSNAKVIVRKPTS